MWNLLGGAIGALGSIYGANKSAQTQEEINAQNINFQANQNLYNTYEQEKFAANQLQWRAQDATAAQAETGINRLALLGSMPISYSNQVAPSVQAPQGISQAYSNAGQSLGRAISAIQSPEEREYSAASQALDLQNKQLNNQYIQAKINEIYNQPGHPPAATYNPTATSGASSTVWPDPNVAVHPDKVTAGEDTTAAGIHPAVKLERNVFGGYSVAPSDDTLGGQFNPYYQKQWAFQNLLLPAFGFKHTGYKDRPYIPFLGYGPPYETDPAKKAPGTIGNLYGLWQ
jgi:hypothetical protein